MSEIPRKRLQPEDYGVAIVCPLEKEMSAIRYMLEEEHEELDAQTGDPNGYIFGSFNKHNVILAWLPQGSQGIGPAAEVSSHLQRSFPGAQLRLLVGIGGGVPAVCEDIRLGDVVIAMPEGTVGGVVQYDFGKATTTGFSRGSTLRAPPTDWRVSIVKFKSDLRIKQNKIDEYHSAMLSKHPKLAETYGRPGSRSDILFHNDYVHVAGSKDCRNCDITRAVTRPFRMTESPKIFYGLIASGNSLIKDPDVRDRVAEDCGGALCFEMEAAGLAADFNCIVIRGICDYADSHKNDIWQEYAAANAAGAAKELLGYMKTHQRLKLEARTHHLQHDTGAIIATENDNSRFPLIKQEIQRKRPAVQQIDATDSVGFWEYAKWNITASLELLSRRAARRKDPKPIYLQSFYRLDYKADLQARAKKICPGTCAWILEHKRFSRFFPLETSGFLWITGSPGLGKTSLATYIVDTIEQRLVAREQTAFKAILYSFFDKDSVRTSSDMISIALCQLFDQHPAALDSASRLDPSYKSYITGLHRPRKFEDLWSLFMAIVNDIGLVRVFLVCDGLDSLEIKQQVEMMQFFRQSSATISVLVLSQPREKVRAKLEKKIAPTTDDNDFILNVDGEEESLNSDIEDFIKWRTLKLGKKGNWTNQELTYVQEFFAERRAGIFLPFSIALKRLKDTDTTDLQLTLHQIFDNMDDLNSLYEGLLTGIPHSLRDSPAKLLSSVLYATRPLKNAEAAFICGYTDGESLDKLAAGLKKVRSDVQRYGSILRYRAVNDTVTFIHESASAFLHKLASAPGRPHPYLQGPSDGHYNIAIQCLDVLVSCSNIKVPQLSSDFYAKKLIEALSQHQFLLYSVENWSIHVKNSLATINASTEKRFKIEGYIITMVEILNEEYHDRDDFILVCFGRNFSSSFNSNKMMINLPNVYCWLGMKSSLREILDSELPEFDITSALQVTAASGQDDIFEFLGNRYNMQDITSEVWSEMLLGAASNGSVAIFNQILLRHEFGVEDIAEAAISAINRTDLLMIEAIKQHRAYIVTLKRNELNVLQWIAACRMTAIDSAVLQKVFGLFIDMGVGLHATDRLGNTLLHLICYDAQKCDASLIRFLARKGINPHQYNRCRWLPLHLASRRAGFDALDTLIRLMNDQDVGFESNQKLTALHWAMQRSIYGEGEDLLVLELLLSHGLSLLQASSSGVTPLEIAIHNPFMFNVLSLILYRLDGITNINHSLLNFLKVFNHFTSVEQLWLELDFIGSPTNGAQIRDRSISTWAVSDDRKIFHLYCVLPRAAMFVIRQRMLSWYEPEAIEKKKENNSRLLLLAALLEFLLNLGALYLPRGPRQALKAAAFQKIKTISKQIGESHSLVWNNRTQFDQLQTLMGQYFTLQWPKELIELLDEHLYIVRRYPRIHKLYQEPLKSHITEEETENFPADEQVKLLRTLSMRYYDEKRYNEAERLETKTLTLFRTSPERCIGKMQLWEALSNLAITKMGRGNKNDDAAVFDLLEEALAVLESQQPLTLSEFKSQVRLKRVLASRYFAKGMAVKGFATEVAIVRLMQDHNFFERAECADALRNLADSYHAIGDSTQSAELMVAAIAVFSSAPNMTMDEMKYVRSLAAKLSLCISEVVETDSTAADDSILDQSDEHEVSNERAELMSQDAKNNRSRSNAAVIYGLAAAVFLSYLWIRRRNS